MRRALALSLLVALAGCDDGNRIEPCRRNQTGFLTLKNCGGATLDISIDGIQVGSLAPHSTSSFEVVAGQHRLNTYFANTAPRIPACNQAEPVVIECGEVVLSCGSGGC